MDFSILENVGLSKDLFESKISAQQIEIDNNTVIFKSGDPCGAFLILISGQIRVEITTKSGRDLQLYRMQENDTCIITTSVLLNHENYYARAITESAVKAIIISADDFHKALSLSHDFSRYVLTGYSQRMSALITLLDRIASKDINYELSNFLLEKVNKEHQVELTQKEIAREVGTVREVISRKLSVLEGQGVVKVQRGKITVLDIEFLQKMVSI